MIAKNLTSQGPGAAVLTISGANKTRIFFISLGAVTIADLTIANGKAKGAMAI